LARLLVHVEGQTEETFVNEVLAPHLYQYGYDRVGARLLGNARLRGHRGGARAWSAVRSDIVGHLRQDRGSFATTMVDYYGLPATGPRAWPGRADAPRLPFERRAEAVEAAMHVDIAAAGAELNPERFLPFVVIHEFEGLLFSDCAAFAQGIGRPAITPAFQAIRDGFDTPEEINDSPHTAPSRRVEALVAGYDKPLLGTLAALEIGLAAIRRECPHFRSWIERLERWVSSPRHPLP
jgi:hypothetical protein